MQAEGAGCVLLWWDGRARVVTARVDRRGVGTASKRAVELAVMSAEMGPGGGAGAGSRRKGRRGENGGGRRGVSSAAQMQRRGRPAGPGCPRYAVGQVAGHS